MARIFEGGIEINNLIRGQGVDTRLAVRLATTAEIAISTGLNVGDTIDGVTLAAGDRVLVKDQSTATAEVTSVTTVADVAGSLGGTYFILNAPGTDYYVWIDVDVSNTDPGTTSSELIGSGRLGIQVAISANDTANTVATAVASAINAVGDFGAPAPGANVVTVTNAVAGPVEDAADGFTDPTGFAISTTTQGNSAVANGIYIVDAVPYRAEDLVTGDAASHIFVHIGEGAVNKNTSWVCTNVATTDVVGTDALTFVQNTHYEYTKGSIIYANTDTSLSALTAPVDISLLQIDNLGNVTWVDKQSVMAGFDPKESVRFGTIAPIVGTYNSTGGTSGTGEFTNVDLTNVGDFDLNGNVVAVNDRLLIKKQNGIYVVTVAGATGTIERAADQDGANPPSNLSSGNFAFIELGATLGQTGWITTGSGVLTVNVDNINWTQFNGTASIIAGAGISITGNTVSADTDGVSLGLENGGVSDTDRLIVRSTATTGQVLRSVGVDGSAATWGALNLASANAVTGTLNEINGGTGQATYLTGDTLYASAIDTLSKLPFNDYAVYTSGASVPAWSNNVYVSNILDPVNSPAAANELLSFIGVASAVNQFTISNAATGNAPTLNVLGNDTNISMNLQPKGTGVFNLLGTPTAAAETRWYENSTNGTNWVGWKAPDAITTNITWTLPQGTATAGYLLQTDGAGITSFVDPDTNIRIQYSLQSSQISVNTTSYTSISYFAWDESEYGNYTNPRIVFYVDVTDRNLMIKVVNVNPGGAPIDIGGPTTISVDGIVQLSFTAPSADTYIAIQVQKSAGGGTNPMIYGLQLEFN